jgi:hypothetical protein
LTNAGRTLEHVLVPLAEEVNEISADGLPDRTLSLVRNALVRMIENLAHEEETRATLESDAGD